MTSLLGKAGIRRYLFIALLAIIESFLPQYLLMPCYCECIGTFTPQRRWTAPPYERYIVNLDEIGTSKPISKCYMVKSLPEVPFTIGLLVLDSTKEEIFPTHAHLLEDQVAPDLARVSITLSEASGEIVCQASDTLTNWICSITQSASESDALIKKYISRVRFTHEQLRFTAEEDSLYILTFEIVQSDRRNIRLLLEIMGGPNRMIGPW